MSALLLLFIWLMFIFGISFLYFKDVMSPAFLMNGSIVVIIFLFICSHNLWPAIDYTYILIPIGMGSTMFLVGSILGKKRIVIRNRAIDRKKNIEEGKFVLSKNTLIVFIGIVYILGLICGSYKYYIAMLYKEAGSFTTQLAEGNSLIEILYQVVIAITYIVWYSLITDIILKEKKGMLLKILCVLPYNIICIITETRFSIFTELMFIVSCMNFIYRINNGQNIKKIFSIVLKSFLTIIVVFVVLGYVVSKISYDRNIVVYVLKYLTVGLFGLNCFLTTFEFMPVNWGAYSFNNLFRILNLFGMNLEISYSTIGKHYYVNETIGTANLYTGFMNLISDFDYWGAMVVVFVLGIISTRGYYSILYGERKNMVFSIIFYSSVMYLLIAIWIEQNPLNMILSSSYIIRSVIVFIILKGCTISGKKRY